MQRQKCAKIVSVGVWRWRGAHAAAPLFPYHVCQVAVSYVFSALSELFLRVAMREVNKCSISIKPSLDVYYI